MQNNFDPTLRYMFEDSWKCMICGMNTANAQHHIVGRGNSGSYVESSILNCAWLCNHKCHIEIHGMIRTDDYMRLLLKQTKNFLLKEHYILRPIDREFIQKYSQYYE